MQWLIDAVYDKIIAFLNHIAPWLFTPPDNGDMIIGDAGIWKTQAYIDWQDAAANLHTTGQGYFGNGLTLGDNIDLDGNSLLNVNALFVSHLTHYLGSSNHMLYSLRGAAETLQTQASGQVHQREHYTKDGDKTDNLQEVWYSQGTPVQQTNLENVRILFRKTAFNTANLYTHAKGSGTIRPLCLGAGNVKEHFKLQSDDDTEMNEGPLDFRWGMSNSAKDPTTDAPDDWIEVKIGGVVGHVPWYSV